LSVQFKMLLFPLLVADKARAGRYDVVDAATGDAWVLSLLRPKRRPYLLTRSHGLEHVAHDQFMADYRRGVVRARRRYFVYHGGLSLRAVATSLRRADASLFINSSDRQYAVSRLCVPAATAFVVAEGLPQRFVGLPTPAPNKRSLSLAVIGSFIRVKGIEYLVSALTQILESHPTLSVSLLGTGTTVDTVFKCFPPGIWPRMSVVSNYRRDQLPILLRGHEICLSMSVSEGFGKGIVEAMACGLAPVVTATNGPRDYIVDGENGIIVALRDADAAVRAVARLVADSALRWKLRQGAYDTAQQFTWDMTAAMRLRIMTDLVEGCWTKQATAGVPRRADLNRTEAK
jgi:glycosyltransferase involved in cell wall biosynthesis